MIKKIPRTEIDLLSMPLRHNVSTQDVAYQDYKNVVVNKPWGYEYLMFENAHVAIWILFLKQSSKTSMHCHPKKKTSLLVLSGKVKTQSLGEHFKLKSLEGILIDKGAFHSTSTEFDSDAFVMEIETPVEKSDLVRLNDEYGRENKGYEGGADLSSDLEKYEYHGFHKDLSEEREIIEKIIKQSNIVLHSKEDWENFYEEIRFKNFCIISFLDVVLKDLNGEIILEAGEICEGDWFLNQRDNLLPSSEKFTVLTVY